LETHASVRETFESLERVAPGVPLLALGQTVFWDEPLKAGLVMLGDSLGFRVTLTAGVHDTDYFAKLPGGVHARDRFVALPRNDGSTRDFWSAAGEFSSLFGSETPVRRETLAEAGVSLDKIAKGDRAFIDQATEAWGWRGVAMSDSAPLVTREVPLATAFETLQSTFVWALEQTVACLSEQDQIDAAREVANKLRTLTCDTREICPGQTIAEFYECLLPHFHRITTGQPTSATITRTSKLLEFNAETARLPRFSFVDLFLRPETCEIAANAYDDAVRGSEVYTLDRFGTGAIPFDLVIPGQGRGTIRLTSQFLIVMTPEPKFVKLARPVQSIGELAAVTDEAFGNCVLVGKAITLISMLASEYVFAFHEGASTYVSHTQQLHKLLLAKGINLVAHPILRIGHDAWASLSETATWLRLPEPLRSPFGAEVVSGATFARSWRCVGEQQRKTIQSLGQARSTAALIRTLHEVKGGRWETLAAEYESLRQELSPLEAELNRIRGEIHDAYNRLREIRREWAAVEVERGNQFRKDIFGKEPNTAALEQRDKFLSRIAELRSEKREVRSTLAELRARQATVAAADFALHARERRRAIEREAELARLRCAQEAVMATVGLEKTNRRPSAWWLSVVSPDGSWFDEMIRRVELRLEPLT
jgi:hypothetical protein